MTRPTFFEVGYDEGFAGKECRVPEGYSARMGYRRGWDQGDMDRRLAANGHSIKGRVDPFLSTERQP